MGYRTPSSMPCGRRRHDTLVLVLPCRDGHTGGTRAHLLRLMREGSEMTLCSLCEREEATHFFVVLGRNGHLVESYACSMHNFVLLGHIRRNDLQYAYERLRVQGEKTP